MIFIVNNRNSSNILSVVRSYSNPMFRSVSKTINVGRTTSVTRSKSWFRSRSKPRGYTTNKSTVKSKTKIK